MKAVEAAGIWKFYGDFPALREVSFGVQAGSCLALLGRNGAGKTTLWSILAGLSRPGRGLARILGGDPRDQRTRARVGVLGHGVGVYDELSALENLEVFGRLYRLPGARRRALAWLERTGLERVRDARVREFSRGMRQRLALARAFLHEPALLLLDEPFTSLDDRAVALLQSLVREAITAGRTVVLSTHQLPEALELATHVALLVRGRLAYAGKRDSEMLRDPGWLYRQYGEA